AAAAATAGTGRRAGSCRAGSWPRPRRRRLHRRHDRPLRHRRARTPVRSAAADLSAAANSPRPCLPHDVKLSAVLRLGGAVTTLKNDRLLRALLRQPVDRTPIWVMRQAGRYLPEYREVRQQAGDFMSLCRNPELACEVTLQPLRRFPLDAAILFSDILTIPDAMGLGLYFETGEGPRFERPVRSAADIDALPIPDPEGELRYVMDAVRLIRRELDGRVPLIGFAGSPWTLATYMAEGGPSKNFSRIKGLLYGQPKLLHQLLDKLSQAVANYLNAQVAAGAQALMIFDSWGGVLSTPAFQEFSLDYAARVLANLQREA